MPKHKIYDELFFHFFSTIYIIIMIFKNFIGFFLLICFVNSATRLIPPELIKVEDHDET